MWDAAKRIALIRIPEPIALTWLPSLLIELAQRAPKLQIEVEI